jgi:nitroreductase
MTIYDLIIARRTIRQFKPQPISREILKKIVGAARLAPSAGNLQPLEYLVVDDPKTRAEIFPTLKWAAYLAPGGDPRPGHEPQAYILTLVNTKVRDQKYEYDVGAANENMMLAALGEGIASCWLISIDRPAVGRILGIPSGHKVDSVLALGYPDQVSFVEAFHDSPRYWQDADLTFHVPKRALANIVHFNKF